MIVTVYLDGPLSWAGACPECTAVTPLRAWYTSASEHVVYLCDACWRAHLVGLPYRLMYRGAVRAPHQVRVRFEDHGPFAPVDRPRAADP